MSACARNSHLPFLLHQLSEPAVSLLGFGGAFLDFQSQLA